MMLLSLTPLMHAQLCVVAMALVARVSFAAVLLASRATIACSHSLVHGIAVAMANARRVAPVLVTTVGEVLTATLIFLVLVHPANALGMVYVSTMANANATLGILETSVQLDPPSALGIAAATATAAPLHSACATKASVASIVARCCLVSRK